MADIDSRRSTNPSYIIADILTHHSNTVILNKSTSDAIFLLSSVNVQSQFLVYDHFFFVRENCFDVENMCGVVVCVALIFFVIRAFMRMIVMRLFKFQISI
jgi:hypothetical protein